MTIIFQTCTNDEIGRWENWNGPIPQKGDMVLDPLWKSSSFTKHFVNGTYGTVWLRAIKPNEIIIYLR